MLTPINPVGDFILSAPVICLICSLEVARLEEQPERKMALNDSMVNIALNRDHGFVFLASAGIAFHAQLSALGVAKARAKTFGSDEFKNRNLVKSLTDEHKKATGDNELPKGGYPDLGNGRYSEALTYPEWYELNNNQRIHQNYLEHLPSIQTFLLLGGLHYPKTAASAGGIFMLGRLLYAHGYRKYGMLFARLCNMWLSHITCGSLPITWNQQDPKAGSTDSTSAS
eukprot:gb/GECG01001617.1/.p1 GENE.gb/GECG01001617.1/~~gb/GECG01001617.1/.p1  ORF type:complete len:227 (+),score=19.33 gb/GECG01001617.1/:1-681(+)